MRLMKTLCLALLSLSTFGCGGVSEAEKGIQELLALTDQITAAVERNDEAEVMKLGQQVKDLAERMKQVKLGQDEQKALTEKYEPEMKKARERLLAAATKNPQMMLKIANFGKALGKF
jgi:hypothetical protein